MTRRFVPHTPAPVLRPQAGPKCAPMPSAARVRALLIESGVPGEDGAQGDRAP
jgi:hypothetical protein